MRSTLLYLIAGAALALSACSSGAPTQAPGVATQAAGQPTDAGGGGGAGPTQAAAATTDSGGGGGGTGGGGGVGSGAGTIHIEISGPVSKTADYAFIAAGSVYGGDQGSTFSFGNPPADSEVVSMRLTSDGKVVILYGNPDFTIPAAECATSSWNISASDSSGSFECHDVMIITVAGATLTGGTVKGNFTAHM